MKRVILGLTVVVLAVVVFSSCKEEKTNEELLTNKKGWVLSKATSTPAYENSEGVVDSDLARSWYYGDYACELNDILYFKSDGDGKRTVLASNCDGNIKQKETLGTWSFVSEEVDNLKLKFRLPFFEEDEEDVVTVTNLDEKNFEFTYTWSPYGATAVYTFRMTYVLGK